MKALFRRDLLVFTTPLFLLVFVGLFGEILVPIFHVDTEQNTPLDLVFFGAMGTMMITILPQSIIGQDENTGWNRFCLTMPVKRTQYVSEKYLLTLGFLIVSALVASGGVISLMVQTTGFDGKMYLLTLSLILGAPLFMMSLDMPLLFRFGMKRGIYFFAGLFLLLFVSGLSVFLWASYTDGGRAFFQQVQEADSLVLAVCILSVSAVIYAVSWWLSCRFYRKQEI